MIFRAAPPSRLQILELQGIAGDRGIGVGARRLGGAKRVRPDPVDRRLLRGFGQLPQERVDRRDAISGRTLQEAVADTLQHRAGAKRGFVRTARRREVENDRDDGGDTNGGEHERGRNTRRVSAGRRTLEP